MPMNDIFATVAILVAAWFAAFQQTVDRQPPPPTAQTNPAAASEEQSSLRLVEQLPVQLSMNDAQKAKFAQIFEAFKIDMLKDPAAIRAQIEEYRLRKAEYRKAQESGDANAIKAARAQLDTAHPGKKTMARICEQIMPILDDAQKERLTSIRTRFESGALTDFRLKPRAIIHLTDSLGLTPEQSATLNRLQDELRARMAELNPRDPAGRDELLAKLVVDVAAALTPEQRAKFAAAVREGDPELAQALDRAAPAKP
ncbi:MAG: hypothetical protein CHACPFDD_00247 [Phycisphaerae bacterium]|nr:hypothetical protein [Phycisphaerae bacterium]